MRHSVGREMTLLYSRSLQTVESSEQKVLLSQCRGPRGELDSVRQARGDVYGKEPCCGTWDV